MKIPIMSSFQEKRILHYNYRDLFNLVLDVESYPEFLPWFSGLTILSRENGVVTAEATVDYKGFKQKYISNITKEEEDSILRIKVEAISGPFKYLKNTWEFEKKNKISSEVSFLMDFAFDSFILERIAGLLFSKVAEKTISAFENRARKLLDA